MGVQSLANFLMLGAFLVCYLQGIFFHLSIRISRNTLVQEHTYRVASIRFIHFAFMGRRRSEVAAGEIGKTLSR